MTSFVPLDAGIDARINQRLRALGRDDRVAPPHDVEGGRFYRFQEQRR